MEQFLTSRGRKLSLDKPLVMGILNVTPDSFSDGGRFRTNKEAVDFALGMIEQGADIVDVGGESSGPGSRDVPLKEELHRVLEVVKMLRARTGAWISVDTYKAEVARSVLVAGADMINDVTALRGDSEMASILAKFDASVVLMYSKDPSARTTKENIDYDDVVAVIKKFFQERIVLASTAGIVPRRLILDPGMGAFVSGDPKYSLQILKRLREFADFELPILVGPSRKSFIGQTLDLPIRDRLEGTLAACAVAVMNGASILRVHDVQECRRVADMTAAIIN